MKAWAHDVGGDCLEALPFHPGGFSHDRYLAGGDQDVVAAARDAAVLCEKLGHIVDEAAPKLDMDVIARASFSIIGSSIVFTIDERCAALGIKPGPDVLGRRPWFIIRWGRKLAAWIMPWVSTP